MASSLAYMYSGDTSHAHLGGLNYTHWSTTEKRTMTWSVHALSRVSVSWEMRTCCSHSLSQTSQPENLHAIPGSKDIRYTSRISINQLGKDIQETDRVVACKERNWVAGGQVTGVTGYFFVSSDL